MNEEFDRMLRNVSPDDPVLRLTMTSELGLALRPIDGGYQISSHFYPGIELGRYATLTDAQQALDSLDFYEDIGLLMSLLSYFDSFVYEYNHDAGTHTIDMRPQGPLAVARRFTIAACAVILLALSPEYAVGGVGKTWVSLR